jgi:TetR/AcrR family transcriptional repressor of nem operon
MKKSKRETAETRRRIVLAAAEAFRRNGIQATGLADIMAAAGLTHGGFYRHFDSKDQLIAEACAASLEAAGDVPRAFAAHYLSAEHRDNPAEGCLFAALGSELARCDSHTREAATAAFLKAVDALAERYGRVNPETAKARALVALSAMSGAITMSRIVTDPKLSAAILRHMRKHLATV